MQKIEKEKLVLEASERQNVAQSLLTQSQYYANLKNWKVAAESAKKLLDTAQDYVTTLTRLAEGTR
jgi:hypothetical protein